MLILLSPSKTQDFENKPLITESKISRFLQETTKLSKVMKNFSATDLSKLMKVSEKIAKLNFDRFQSWNADFSQSENEKQAIFAFKGDVYRGFDLENWTPEDYNFAESSLRIISGFYGIITPQTLIKPYRLEMGTRLKFGKYKNLYEFWSEKLTKKLAKELEKNNEKIILNLASNEYSKAVNLAKFGDKVIDIYFKVMKNGKYKTIGIYAKRQRGKMANWVIENKITKKDDLVYYPDNNFKFSDKLSNNNGLVFVKK